MTTKEQREYHRQWRKAHPDYYRNYQKRKREWFLNYYKQWAKKNRGYWMARQRESPLEHKKQLARHTLNRAVRKGIAKKLPCEKKRCGNENSQGHHTDYNEPLTVTWLCKPHHMELHRKLV